MADVQKSYDLDSGVTEVMLGSSQIGCSFNPKHNRKILWVEASPPAIVECRITEIFRRNPDRIIQLVVTDFGPQAFCLQTRERICHSWWREMPVLWTYLRRFPYGYHYLAHHIACNLQNPFRFDQKWGEKGGRPSKMDQTEEWRESELSGALSSHYSFYQDADETEIEERYANTVMPYLKMFRMCKEKCVRFVIVIAPLSADYRASIPEKASRMFARAVSDLKDAGVELVDGRDCDILDEKFCDSIHLTNSGAVEFERFFYSRAMKKR